MPTADRTDSLIPQFWEQATRLQPLDETICAVGRILAERFPVRSLTVTRIDRDGRTLRTLAAFRPGNAPPVSRPDVPDHWLDALEAWCNAGEVEVVNPADSDHAFAGAAAPDDPPAPFLLGPLGVSRDKRRLDTPGIVALSADSGYQLREKDKPWLEALLGPLNVAIENDARLRKLTSQREAAESERRALMFELGKKPPKDVIVGAEGGLAGVMERVNLVAKSDAPVLIFGETGTGKEVIARAIHVRSQREAQPFHRVNCGALPPELIDSHLFGHEEGAFTGATETRKGWFERADGGTLFLDEIGDLPAAAQVRLLRILQDGHFERVGGQKSIQVDVRIVAATHRDLAQMVADSAFREDLWYRIAVFPVYLPPLRERLEDIPALAAHFAEKAAVRFGLPLVEPSETDIEALKAYAWPGNIRELGAVLDRAALLGNGRFLDIHAALGVSLKNGPTASSRPTAGGASLPPAEDSASASGHIDPLDTVIRRHIERALAATSGRIEGPGGAAELLEINPHTLRSRMRKMGIDWGAFRGEGSNEL